MAISHHLRMEKTDGRRIAQLAIPPSVDLYPSSLPSILGVVVRPMYHPALFVPFILAAKGDSTTGLDRRSRGQIDVMGYKESVTGRDADNEPLMPRKVHVIR